MVFKLYGAYGDHKDFLQRAQAVLGNAFRELHLPQVLFPQIECV